MRLVANAPVHIDTSSRVHPPAPRCRQAGDFWLGTLNLRFSKQASPAPATGGPQALPAPSRLVPLPFPGGTFNATYNLAQRNPFVFTTPRRLLRAVITSLITGGCAALCWMGVCDGGRHGTAGLECGAGGWQPMETGRRRGQQAAQTPPFACCAQPARRCRCLTLPCHLQATGLTPTAAPNSAPVSTGSQSTASCTATRWARVRAATTVRWREGGRGSTSSLKGGVAVGSGPAAQLQPALLHSAHAAGCKVHSRCPLAAACSAQAAPTQ